MAEEVGSWLVGWVGRKAVAVVVVLFVRCVCVCFAVRSVCLRCIVVSLARSLVRSFVRSFVRNERTRLMVVRSLDYACLLACLLACCISNARLSTMSSSHVVSDAFQHGRQCHRVVVLLLARRWCCTTTIVDVRKIYCRPKPPLFFHSFPCTTTLPQWASVTATSRRMSPGVSLGVCAFAMCARGVVG